jgi:hypothetical protein
MSIMDGTTASALAYRIVQMRVEGRSRRRVVQLLDGEMAAKLRDDWRLELPETFEQGAADERLCDGLLRSG